MYYKKQLWVFHKAELYLTPGMKMNDYLTRIAISPRNILTPNAGHIRKCLLILILSGQAYIQWEL